MADTGVRVVLVTVPAGDAGQKLARAIVEERLAACVNRLSGVRSIYRWKGKICDDGEELLVIKTTETGLARLQQRVLELHPYDVPEFLALPVEAGAARYMDWIRGEVDGVK